MNWTKFAQNVVNRTTICIYPLVGGGDVVGDKDNDDDDDGKAGRRPPTKSCI